MPSAARLAVPLAALALTACGGVRVITLLPAPPRSADCKIDFLREAPKGVPYDVLADLSTHTTKPATDDNFEVLRPAACAAGADVVIIYKAQVLNEFGHMLLAATAVRMRPYAMPRQPEPAATPAPAEPAPAPAVAPAPEASPAPPAPKP